MICPYCNKQINDYSGSFGKHVYNCSALKDKSADELKLIHIQYSTNDKNIKEKVAADYIKDMSLPELKSKYKLCYKHILFLVKYSGIIPRTMSESQRRITVKKNVETSRKHWGVDNPSQAQEIKDKKAETFTKHYGVDNIWKTPGYAEFTRKRWKLLTPQQKEDIILKKWKASGYISNIELKTYTFLKELGYDVEPQFMFETYSHKYDIHILNTNILIEVNGNWWHLNPKLYNEDYELKVGTYKIKAKDKWELDKKHIEYANKNNYIVYTIWEQDIISRTDKEYKEYLINLLNNGKTEKKSKHISED